MKYLIAVLLVILTGCSAKTATETIVEEAIKDIDQFIEYADKNIADTPETVLLKDKVKSCRTTLVSCEQSCDAEIRAEKNNTAYWKLACGSLFGALLVLVYLFIRKR
jgi:hypothetical protein